MSNRVVAIKILGVGEVGVTQPATFTTRAHPLYSSSLAGTVTSLANQLSSEIAVFGNLGSDSTTSFTVLSTAATREILLSRGKVPLRDIFNQPARMQGYVPPDPGYVQLPSNGSSFYVDGNYYRVQNTAFRCFDAATSTFERVWGCAPVPLALSLESQDSFIGSVVYDLNNGNPLGGCEGLPVVIETVDLDSLTPEVIFRGYISKVSNDTSMGAQNLLRVDCSSMMAYLKQAPFVPAWGSVAVTLAEPTGGVFTADESRFLRTANMQTSWEPLLWGDLYDPLSPVTGATVSTLWQVREEGKGGIAMRHDFGDGFVGINSEYTIAWGSGATVQDNGYRMCFDDGYYMTGDYGPTVSFDVDITTAAERDRYVHRYSNRVQQQRPTLRGENCIEGNNFAGLILDLLLGTYNTDLTFTTGARSVNESAWLPFPSVSLSDLVDLPSLNALFIGVDQPDIPFVQVDGLNLGYLLPYEPASAKTVGDVLEAILKRLGAYIVYDKGKFYFGSWNGARQTPTVVTDADLSDPKISLTFERGLQLQRVDATFATSHDGEKVVKFAVPFNNPDLSTIGLGKTMMVGHWEVPFAAPDDPSWGQTRMMANAFGLLMRYSQSAARVDLSLRDSAVDLDVGQEVALTTDFIVNSSGDMGVQVLTGYVLKAARSWQTPTTAYTIILPGYLSPQGTVNVWSCSALVVDVPGGDDIQVDTNVFTAPSVLAAKGAPVTDAETFKLTYDLYGNWYDVQLLDQYGTQKYVGGLTGINLATNMLTLPGFDAYAAPGDIIVLASAPAFGAGVADLYDVFQADSAGQVNGSTTFARKWVP